MISELLHEQIKGDIQGAGLGSCEVQSIKELMGGDINAVYEITTNLGKFVVKKNFNSRFPNLFEYEKNGLEEIAKTQTIQTPKVISTGLADFESYILLEWIEKTPPANDFWLNFAHQLADLHQVSSESFGFYEDNYIGSLKQLNTRSESCCDFFIEQRLKPQLEIAARSKLISNEILSQFELLFHKLDDLIPKEEPSLLHGDLWSGNYLSGPKGVVLIDPAVYYGHREKDIAMTKLFGGFDDQFYRHYHEKFPMESGWEERIELFNLYPLLVHLNLFGLGYLKAVSRTVRKFL